MRCLSLPADYVGIQAITAGLAVCSVTHDVRFVTVIAGKLVHVRMAPRVVPEILHQIGTVPLIDATRLLPHFTLVFR